MRKLRLLVVVAVCAVVLSGCMPSSLLSHEQLAANRMAQIADAVKHDDADALKKLFSPYAVKNASDLDAGVKYFLSLFPDHTLTWKVENGGPNSSDSGSGGASQSLYAMYTVTVDGKKYWLRFVDSTFNTSHPDRVGLFALGMTPRLGDAVTDASPQFVEWARSMQGAEPISNPGVFVPN